MNGFKFFRIRIFIILIIIIGLALLAFVKFFDKEKSHKTDKTLVDSKSSPVSIIEVGENKYVQKKQETFEVVNWDSGNAELIVKDDQNNQKTIKINPESMKLLVPVVGRGKKGQFIAVTNNKGIDWEWAFCQGDEVNISTDESGSVIMIMNIGYRMCSFGRE